MRLLDWLRIRKVGPSTQKGGDPFYKYRQSYKEKGILPEKYEFGMNCFLDTLDPEVRQAVYEELIRSNGIGTVRERPTTWEDIGQKVPWGETGTPALFGIRTLSCGLDAYNKVATKKKAIFALDKKGFVRIMMEKSDLDLTFLVKGGTSIHATTQKVTDILLGTERHLAQGHQFCQTGKYTEAIGCYDKAIEIEPLDARAWHNKAAALGEAGRYKEAIECQDKVLEIAPKYLWAWHNKAVSLSRLERYQEAGECCDKAIEINPKLAVIWEKKARILFQMGKEREGSKCLSKACELDPKLLREQYRPLEWVDKLQEEWRNQGKNPSDDAFLWIDKGSELWAQGDKEKSVTCLKIAAQINPSAKIQLLDGNIVTAGDLVDKIMRR